MSQLKVPYFKQESGLTCGLACLRMALGYYGDQTTEKELVKQIQVHKYGIFTTDLGVLAQKRGYKTTIFSIHLRLLAPLKLPFGTEVSTKILAKVKPTATDKKTYDSWQEYLKSGGRLVWDVPKVSMIESFIAKRIPCLVNINTAALNRYWKNWDNGHYLTVNGVVKDNISVLDPDPWDKTDYFIEKDVFLPSWAINAKLSSGFLMVIEK